MSDKDYVRRFVFEELDARGCVVSLDDASSAIQQTHYYPPNLAKLLNEFAVAAVLLHDSIKIVANITIQLRSTHSESTNPISLLMADCMPDRKVRAIAEYQSELLGANTDLDLGSFANNSTLTITITPQDAERYQSIVPLEHSSLSECLEDYFKRSEQLPTWFKLVADEQRAVGIAIHALPAEKITDTAISEDSFKRLKMLLDTLKHKEALQLDCQEMLTRLFHQESCRVFEPDNIEFGCICSAQKSLDAIKSLGEQEVAELLAEQKSEGKESVFVDCHFCFQRYEFSFDQIRSVFG
ncbi:MAG: Hsp33 family molecular chaperone HslO [Acidiferrobacterales bacterium]|nr:Hsp33 family molecular chaperone HslO [Acidiferrobacterales bacterium]